MSQKKPFGWAFGLFMASLLFAALFLTLELRYYGPDDTPILRSFMGYEGGVPAQFHLYLHTAFAWLLHGLALLLPGVAWFSILQLFLLWLSCAVIAKCFFQGGLVLRSTPSPAPPSVPDFPAAPADVREGKNPLWLPACALMALLFLLVFAAYLMCRISYTTTAALLGAAAVAQLLSVDVHERPAQILRGMGLSIALLMCCYCLRQISLVPPLAFWLLGLGQKAYACVSLEKARRLKEATRQETESGPARSPAVEASAIDNAQALEPSTPPAPVRLAAWKPFLCGALICALCFGVMAGIRAAEISLRGAKDFLAWHNARIRLFDYTAFEVSQSPDLLEDLGWSEAKMALVTNWYFMDSDITTQAFETIYAAQPEAALGFWGRVERIPQVLKTFTESEPGYSWAALALLTLWLFRLFLFTALPADETPLSLSGRKVQRKRRFLNILPLLLALPLGIAMVLFLAYEGRMPLRAAASVLLPLGVFLSSVRGSTSAPQAASAFVSFKGGRSRRISAPAGVACVIALFTCLCLCVFSISATAQRVFEPMDPETEARLEIPEQMDAYALANPDILIIHNRFLANDRRLFPDASEGIPGNIIAWGDWPARTPSWQYQLAQYGIDGNAFAPGDFLRENVVLAGLSMEPPHYLLEHVSQSVGPVDWYMYDEDGYLFLFALYPLE